jgi:hypothetical protein
MASQFYQNLNQDLEILSLKDLIKLINWIPKTGLNSLRIQSVQRFTDRTLNNNNKRTLNLTKMKISFAQVYNLERSIFKTINLAISHKYRINYTYHLLPPNKQILLTMKKFHKMVQIFTLNRLN